MRSKTPESEQNEQEKGDKETERKSQRANVIDFKRGIPALQLSPQDKLILKQCNKESFIYRCIPCMALFNAVLVFRAIKTKTQPRAVHYLGAFAGGYLCGNLSYIPNCEQKIANSSSTSPFAQQVRQRLGMPLRRTKSKKFEEEKSKDDEYLKVIVQKSDD